MCSVVKRADKGTRFLVALKWGMLALSLLCCGSLHAISTWRSVTPGIEYQDLQNFLTPWSHIHVFRIQLKQHQLALASAHDEGLKMAFVSELAAAHHAKLAVNGGFFDKNFRPLGLRIHRTVRTNPMKDISWWGVFSVQANQAYLVRSSEFNRTPDTTFAIQSGPRLVVQGHIPGSLKPGRDERTVLGVTQTGEALIIVTENAPMTTTELAELISNPPVMAWNALNLDGGSSTQLYADFPELKLDLHGFALVADAVVVE